MKNHLLTVAAASLLAAATSALAQQPAPATPNQNACFGHARSADASDPNRRPIGQIFAERQGDNAQMNRTFREACQAQTPPPPPETEVRGNPPPGPAGNNQGNPPPGREGNPNQTTTTDPD